MKDLKEEVESPSFSYVRNKLKKSGSVSMDVDSKSDFLAPLRERSRKLHQLISAVSKLSNGDLDEISE